MKFTILCPEVYQELVNNPALVPVFSSLHKVCFYDDDIDPFHRDYFVNSCKRTEREKLAYARQLIADSETYLSTAAIQNPELVKGNG